MTTDGRVAPADLERFRSYLRLIARLPIPAALNGKLDPSDVVQDALVKGLERLDQFHGRTEGELSAWLRQILATTLANLARGWGRERSGPPGWSCAANTQMVSRLAFSPGGTRLATASEYKTVRVWDVAPAGSVPAGTRTFRFP
jgi:DNA-directed RNA polymerase specialized sigma24 family protein